MARTNKIRQAKARRRMKNLVIKILVTIVIAVLLGIVIGLMLYLYLLEQCKII